MTYRSATVNRGRSKFKFIGETIAELKKVVWLSRREATYLTGLVLIVSITVGLILAVIDLGFTNLIEKVFLGG
ncbi:preprotein translocase subunit SecE [Chloroflexota bacterium]